MSSFLARRVVAAPRIARAFSTTPARPVAKITIVGNLAGPPDLQATSTGREILRYSVASNQGRGDNSRTSWFRVTSFEQEGPRRDYLQSLTKGCVVGFSSATTRAFLSLGISAPWTNMTMCLLYRTLVFVEGDASMDRYEDAEGKTRNSLSIIQRELPSCTLPPSGHGSRH